MYDRERQLLACYAKQRMLHVWVCGCVGVWVCGCVASNLKAERSALFIGLSKRQDLVIKPFDKGRGICALNVTDYIHEGERQLSGPHYEELREDQTGETLIRVAQAARNLYTDNIISREIYEFLNPDNHHTKHRAYTSYRRSTKKH